MSVLALIPDLLMQSQVRAAGQRAGVDLAFVPTSDALVEGAAAAQPGLIVIDLSQGGLDLQSLVPRIKSIAAAARILAFGPHVHKGLLERAKEAGCDEVISRGQFHAEMDALMNGH